MEWSEPLPYIVSGVVALLTAFLTHRRANKAHKNTVIIDHQKLVNETYEAVLLQLREELERRSTAHDVERVEWETRESRLRAEIQSLRNEVSNLKTEVRSLKSEKTGPSPSKRHPRIPEDGSGTDLPT